MKKLLFGLIGTILLLGFSFPAQAKPISWENIKVTDLNGSYQSATDVAYGAGKFGVVYTDYRNGNREVYFSLLSHKGKKISEDLNVSNDLPDSMEPVVIWNGKNFGIFWWEHWNVRYAAVSAKGKIVVSPVLISSGVHISAVWNKKTHEYGVSWWGDAGGGAIPGAVFTRMDRKGNKLSPIIALNSVIESDYYRPRIATSGKDYGLTWSDWRGCSGTCPVTVFTAVNKNGEKIVVDKAITSTTEGPQSIVWNGYEYAIVRATSTGVSLLRVDNGGNVLSSSILQDEYTLSHADYLGLLWVKNHYVMSMKSTAPSTPNSADIFVASFDGFGNTIDCVTKISNSPNHDYFPSEPVLAGNNIAVTWVGNLSLPDENITFAQGKNL